MLTLNRAPTSEQGVPVSVELPNTCSSSHSISGKTRRQVYELRTTTTTTTTNTKSQLFTYQPGSLDIKGLSFIRGLHLLGPGGLAE